MDKLLLTQSTSSSFQQILDLRLRWVLSTLYLPLKLLNIDKNFYFYFYFYLLPPTSTGIEYSSSEGFSAVAAAEFLAFGEVILVTTL